MHALSLIAISVCFSMKATKIRAQTCYFPDGSVSTDDAPCRASSSDQPSPCCKPTDVCLDNALCLAQSGPEGVSRGSCTDKTWQSSECPQYCQDGQLPQKHAKSEIIPLPSPLLVVFSPPAVVSNATRILSVLTLLSSSRYLVGCTHIHSRKTQFLLLWTA